MSNFPKVLIKEDGLRPAGNPNECFYCNQKIGQEHSRDCVVIGKKIKARYIFEVELKVPHFWDKGDFEFHRNEGSWCATNAIDELKEQEGCLCDVFEAEFLEVIDDTPLHHEKSDSREIGTKGENDE